MSGQAQTNSESKEHHNTTCNIPLPSNQQNLPQSLQDSCDTCSIPAEDNSCSCENSTASRPVTTKLASSGACVKLAAGCKTVTAGSNLSAAAAAASAAFVAAKLGLCDQLESALARTPALASLKDAEGRCCLHYAAGYGHEECVDLLLDKGGPDLMRLRDHRGDLPLHMAAQQGHPMCTYNLAKACTASCMAKNKAGHSPIEVAAAAGRGEVLNAMLLACSGDGNSTVAVAAMRLLLAAGAVPDTWAPNGSSALMLAAAANSVAALQVLLEGGATVELQDALGRSALMFAAGSDATAACDALLGAHASLSVRDRRGRAALDYATAGSASAKLLQKRLDELECVASQLQQQLLQEGALTASTATKQAKGKNTPAGVGVAAGVQPLGAAEAPGSSKKKKKKKTANKATPGSTDGHGLQNAEATTNAPPAEAATPPPVDILAAASNGGHSITGYEVAKNDSAAVDAEAGCVRTAAEETCSTAGTDSKAALDGSDSKLGTQATALLSVMSGATPPSGGPAQGGAVDVPAAEAQVQPVQDSHDEEWHVVVPKGKHRTALPVNAALPAAAGSHAGVSGAPSATKGIRCQSHSQAGGSGTNALHQQALVAAASLAAGQEDTQAGRHHAQLAAAETAAATAVRHKRQGSAHSICSTVSFASCDSSSCSALSCTSTHASGCSSTVRTTAPACSHSKGWHAKGQPRDGQQDEQTKSNSSIARMTTRLAAAPLPSEQPHQHMEAGTTGFKDALLKGGQEPDPHVVHAAAKVATTVLTHGSVGANSTLQTQGAEQREDSSSMQDRKAAIEVESGQCRSAADVSRQDVDSSLGAKVIADLVDTSQEGEAAGAADSATGGETAAEQAAELQGMSGVSNEVVENQEKQQPDNSEVAVHPATGSSGSAEHQEQLQQMAAELLQARTDLAAAQLQLRQQVAGHQQQLAAILENAAAHEAAAVQAAVEGAVLETLQSPLLLQVLSAGVHQAVIRERATTQARLLQFGLPPGAVLHILSQPAAADAAAGHSMTEPVSLPNAAARAQGKLSCADADTGACAEDPHVPASATAASSVSPAPECTLLMAHMLSTVAHNVLTSSAASGSSTLTAQQLQLQQMLSLQRLRRQHHQPQQQGFHETAATPKLHLDLRSEYCGGSSTFVAPLKKQADNDQQQLGPELCSVVGDGTLTLQRGNPTECTPTTDAKDAPLLDTAHRRSSSGCSTMSTVDDVLVPHGGSAPRSSFGTIGCCTSAAPAHSSSSPHSSSCCSSAFGPAGHIGSPPGGGTWGDLSVAGSPALGTSPLLGPGFTLGLQSSQQPAGQRHSLLGSSADAAFASERAATAAAAAVSAVQGGLVKHTGLSTLCTATQHPGVCAQGSHSLESSRLVDLLPDEL